MTAKVELKPDTKYSYPSNRNYFDDSTSTLADGKVFDASKRGGDYGIVDPEVAVEVVEYTPLP